MGSIINIHLFQFVYTKRYRLNYVTTANIQPTQSTSTHFGVHFSERRDTSLVHSQMASMFNWDKSFSYDTIQSTLSKAYFLRYILSVRYTT